MGGACTRTFTVPAGEARTGTGTISSSGTTVTGSGTAFTTELQIGDTLIASGQKNAVIGIGSDTSLAMNSGFSPAIPAGTAFTYCNPITRWLDSSGNTVALLDASGYLGLARQFVGAAFGVTLPKPAAVSSGDGRSQTINLFDITGGAGGNTSAIGATGGAGAFSGLTSGAGGAASGASGHGGKAGELDLEGAPGGDAIGAGGVGGNGGAVVLNPGPGGAVISGTPGNPGVLFVNQFAQSLCYGGTLDDLSDCKTIINASGEITKIRNVKLSVGAMLSAMLQANAGGM